MLTEACPERVNPRSHAARGEARSAPTVGPKRVLAVNEFLFRDGQHRGDVFRVERGALCHYIVWEDGHHEIIEFAFPGDLIGFGHRDAHISTVQAMVETEVSVVSPEEFREGLEADAQLAARVAAADDREFAYGRALAVNASADKPVERVASLIAALSH